MRSLFASFVASLVLMLVPAGAHAALGELSVVSRADGFGGAIGELGSYTYSNEVSADGRYVAFISYADNFGGPFPAERNAYRRDLALGRTELISRATGVAGAVADDTTFNVSMSADGNRIAFASGASNLSSADDDSYNNVYVRDVNAATTTLVSRASGVSGAAALGSSFIPKISGNGNIVTFQSSADNLDPLFADNNNFQDVFIRDLVNNTTRLISRSTGNIATNATSYSGDISYDGRYVAFLTDATNIGGTIAAGTANIYVRDRAASTTVLASQPTGSTNVSGNASSGPASITDDGKKVAFSSRSTNFAADATDGTGQIYLRDLNSTTTSLVSRSTAGARGDAESDEASISPDGSLVAFTSLADNLDTAGGDFRQAFVRLLDTGVTRLVSRAGQTGPPGDSNSDNATSGWSNRYALFATESKNLVAGVNNGSAQIYLRDVRAPEPPAPLPATITGKKFVATLKKKAFKIKVTTGGGATSIAGKITISVAKRIVKSGKIVIKLKTLTVPAARTSHTLKFKLSKTQNKRLLKALRTKKSRAKAILSLTATAPGGSASAKISGKLRR